MYSQLISDGGEPHWASGVRLLKTKVALSTGIGFLVGAIVGVSFFASTLHNIRTAETSSLVALPISRQAKGPFYGMGINQAQQSNAYAGLASMSTVHRVKAELEDRYAKPPNDPFYGVGAKQVRQSSTYAGLPSLPTALPSWSDEQDRYAKGPDDRFTGMGMGLEKPNAPFPVQGRDVARTYAGLQSLPTALPSWSEQQDRYAKGPNDAFTGMSMGLEKPNAPFPVEGRDAANAYAGLPPVPTALPSKNYAGLRSSYGAISKEGQRSTIELESLRV